MYVFGTPLSCGMLLANCAFSKFYDHASLLGNATGCKYQGHCLCVWNVHKVTAASHGRRPMYANVMFSYVGMRNVMSRALWSLPPFREPFMSESSRNPGPTLNELDDNPQMENVPLRRKGKCASGGTTCYLECSGRELFGAARACIRAAERPKGLQHLG